MRETDFLLLVVRFLASVCGIEEQSSHGLAGTENGGESDAVSASRISPSGFPHRLLHIVV